MKGIIHITGEHDTGKTLAGLTLYPLKQIALFHDDVKLPPLDINELGYCCNLIDQNITFGQLRQSVLAQVKHIPENIECIIFDTFTRFESSCQIWGKANYHLFREKETMAKGQEYRWGQEWSEAHYYIAKVINNLSERFESVILITHLKDHFQAGIRTGKEIPAATKVLDRICNLRLWLRNNPNSGVPIILVLKRIVQLQQVDGIAKPINLLPRKITPQPEHYSVWDALNYYQENPMGNREPEEKEKPTLFELSILDGILTNDQKEVWKANQKQEQLAEVNKQSILIERVKELSNLGWMEIQRIIKDEMGEELSPTYIMEIIG